jgi:Fructose-2,6-bisphosphatase
MRLILIRHGRTPSNTGFVLDTAFPGADLDETGREQAESLVERLAAEPIEAIYVSNLVRTQQTAAPLAAARGLVPVILTGLREISAGDDELSMDSTRYVETLLKWHAGELDARLPGGEDAREFFARYDDAIGQIVAAGHQEAALVSHGAALRVWAAERVDGFAVALGAAHLDNTGVLVVEGSPAEGWQLQSLDGVTDWRSADFEPA